MQVVAGFSKRSGLEYLQAQRPRGHRDLKCFQTPAYICQAHSDLQWVFSSAQRPTSRVFPGTATKQQSAGGCCWFRRWLELELGLGSGLEGSVSGWSEWWSLCNLHAACSPNTRVQFHAIVHKLARSYKLVACMQLPNFTTR